jgi:uncharacterized protein YbjT (DUF2867 family)
VSAIASDRILLIGATGHVGVQLLRRLRGRPAVRVFAHSDRSAAMSVELGFETARGDLHDRTAVRAALDGVERLFLLTGPVPDQAALEIATVEAADAAGVRHLVNVSTVGVEMETVAQLSRPHAEVEARIARSRLRATLLRPDVFMTNLLNNLPDLRAGRIVMPAGESRFAMVDPRDVADVAAVALTSDEPPVGPVAVSGPELLDWHDVAERVGHALRRPISYEPADVDAFRSARVAAGVPAILVDGIAELWQRIAAEPPRGVVDTQLRRLGRPPRTLATWLTEEGVAMLSVAEPALAAPTHPAA